MGNVAKKFLSEIFHPSQLGNFIAPVLLPVEHLFVYAGKDIVAEIYSAGRFFFRASEIGNSLIDQLDLPVNKFFKKKIENNKRGDESNHRNHEQRNPVLLKVRRKVGDVLGKKYNAG